MSTFVRLSARRTRQLALALLPLLAIVVSVGTETASAAEPGVVGGLTWFPSEADRAREATLTQDSGSKWVRLNLGWRDFEPSKGNYNTWSLDAYEREFRRAKEAGQKVIVSVHTTPQWASGSADENAPPTDPADYADFIRFVSGRYAQWVDAWEIWNEPNLSRFWTNPDPAAYTRLLNAAYPAVKSGDPTAAVVFGGLSTSDYEFVAAAYRAGAKGSFDVMGVHPYSCAQSPESVVRNADGRINRGSFPAYREVRATMLANGDDKPIWFTEFGWTTSTSGCGVSESTQADYLSRAYKYIEQDRYVQVATWYNMRNNWWLNDADEDEARFGLVNSDFSPKPSYTAFRNYALGLSAPTGKKKRRWLAISAQRDSAKVVVRGRVQPVVSSVSLQLHRKTAAGWIRVARAAAAVRGGRISSRIVPAQTSGRLRVRAVVEGRRDLSPILSHVRS